VETGTSTIPKPFSLLGWMIFQREQTAADQNRGDVLELSSSYYWLE
jgi:hypothetical protein